MLRSSGSGGPTPCGPPGSALNIRRARSKWTSVNPRRESSARAAAAVCSIGEHDCCNKSKRLGGLQLVGRRRRPTPVDRRCRPRRFRGSPGKGIAAGLPARQPGRGHCLFRQASVSASAVRGRVGRRRPPGAGSKPGSRGSRCGDAPGLAEFCQRAAAPGKAAAAADGQRHCRHAGPRRRPPSGRVGLGRLQHLLATARSPRRCRPCRGPAGPGGSGWPARPHRAGRPVPGRLDGRPVRGPAGRISANCPRPTASSTGRSAPAAIAGRPARPARAARPGPRRGWGCPGRPRRRRRPNRGPALWSGTASNWPRQWATVSGAK